MNNLEEKVLENLKTRRSIRSYKSEMIDDSLLEKIVEAGTYAPTGKNLQSPIILVVKNKEIRDKLANLNALVMGNSNIDPFYGAPVVLLVLAKKSVATYLYDGSLVMGNLMNAAHALGIGSCWIHRAKEVFEMPFGKELLKELGINEEYEGIGNCILGYPKEEVEVASKRKDNYVYYLN